MAKRFTDTNKLKKKWLRGLKAPYKLLWVYLLDACDHAGIWEVDFEIANIYIGGGVSEEKAQNIFKDRIHIFDNGDKWLIVDFIDFQYNGLNEKNPAHNNVIKVLNRYNLIDNSLKLKDFSSPFKAPCEGTKEEEEEKEKVKVKEKVILPFESENFIKIWNIWKDYKNKEHSFKYKSHISEQASLNKLNEMSSCNENISISIIKQSIENGWKGFVELKTNYSNTKIDYKNQMDDYKNQIINDINNA